MPTNLAEVDGVKIQPKHRATCHCGAVELELDLPEGLIDVRRCDCSMCRRRGAIAASVTLDGINEGIPTYVGVNHPADQH